MEHSAIDRSKERNAADDTYRQVADTVATALPGCGRENRAWEPRGQGQTSAACPQGPRSMAFAKESGGRPSRGISALRSKPRMDRSRRAFFSENPRNQDGGRTTRRLRQSGLREAPACQRVILKTPVHLRRRHQLCQLPSGFRGKRPRPRPTPRGRPQPIRSSHGKHVCSGKLAR
jgi:hypothetical protein